jgi:transcriptional regulator with XRE-family HTH domain
MTDQEAAKAWTPRETMRAWREYRGLTQRGLGKLSGYHWTFIRKIENGEKGFTVDYLESTAAALQCSPGDLLSYPPVNETAWNTLTAEEQQLVSRFLSVLRAAKARGEL